MVDFTIRARLVYALRGGGVPRLSTDEPTDIDIFPETAKEQRPGEETQESGSTQHLETLRKVSGEIHGTLRLLFRGD